jgi:hypothetical protein
MAHFAQVTDGIVVSVLVVPDDQEHRGSDYLAVDLGLGGIWYQTSYNTHGNVHSGGGTPRAYNYAGVGYTYDAALDAFRAPQPWPSWILDAETQLWEAPVAVPDDDGTYRWNENDGTWVAV